jgi:hypothetical protein
MHAEKGLSWENNVNQKPDPCLLSTVFTPFISLVYDLFAISTTLIYMRHQIPVLGDVSDQKSAYLINHLFYLFI